MNMPEINGSWESIVFLIFSACILIQIAYCLWVFTGLTPTPPARVVTKYPAVSIVICARNEADNLQQNIPKWCEQNYPDFEVIIVNDQSSDDSKYIVRAYQEKYENLRLVNLERARNFRMGKKLPLTVGIKGAKNPYILLSDADCKPFSKVWVRRMASHFSDKKKIVLGYSPYLKSKGVLNALIRFDTVLVALQYLNLAKRGFAYMGVGRNLGYSKDLFDSVNGFKSHYHIPSGDDDLFVQEAAQDSNFTIDYHQESFVYSFPQKDWSSWLKQKRRHFQTAPQYGVFNKLLLAIYPITLFLLIICFVILLSVTNWWAVMSIALITRGIIYWIFWGITCFRLGSKDLIPYIPILELFFLFFHPIAYAGRPQTTDKKWQ